MEGVWLKTEPIDDTFDDCFSIKLEQGIAEPLTIIEQDDSRTVCINSNDASEEIESDPIRKADFKKRVKKSQHKTSQRKQQKKGTTAKSDAEEVGKKSGDKKRTQGRKAPERVKKSYICEECGKEFTGASGLNRHKLLHSGLRPYVCSVEGCAAAFSQSSTLKSHQMSHTGERKFFCEECGQGFQSKFHMQAHQRSRHNGERPYVCVECGEAFTRKQGLTRHQLEHHLNEKPFECTDCGMRFFEKILLRSHKKTHTTGGKPYVCTECGKGFFHNTSLTAHKRNHSTVRQFACEVCGKRFTQKGTLKIHKVIHSDVRPFGCPECGLRFTQKFTLKTHRIKQHGLSTSPQKQQKTIHSGLPEAEPKSLNDKILPSGYDNIRRPDTSDSNATVAAGMSRKLNLPLNRKDELEEETLAIESVFGSPYKVKIEPKKPSPILTHGPLAGHMVEAGRSEERSEVGSSSPSLKSESSCSESEFKLETNDDESSDDKFALDRSTDALQPQAIAEISTSLDQIKEELQSSEPFFLSDVWKSERTDEDYLSVSEKPIKKQSAKTSADRPFSCGKCDRTFALVGALKNHQRSHKRDGKKREKPTFVCDECGKVVSGKEHLKIHKRIHSGSTPYSCTDCGKSFTQLGNLKTHQLTHSGLRPFPCDTCGMAFSKKNTLDKHKRTHTNIKAFECDVCGKKFKHSSSIKRHKLCHTGQKDFGCDICGKTFSEKSYIKFHLRTHTGYKPFACDLCPSTFIDKSQLTQHKGYSHRRVGEPSPYRRRKLQKMMKMANSLV